jgi:hypothetical protein
MKFVKQRGDYDCGIACLAMVTGLTYAQAKTLMFPPGHGWCNELTDHYDIKKALEKAGVERGRRFVRGPKKFSGMHKTAIVAASMNKTRDRWHWVVFDAERGKILDPEKDLAVSKCRRTIASYLPVGRGAG